VALSPPCPFVPSAASQDPAGAVLMGTQPHQETKPLRVLDPGRWVPVLSLLSMGRLLEDVGLGCIGVQVWGAPQLVRRVLFFP